MASTLLRRLLPLPVVVLAASLLVFLLPRLAGIDTARSVLRSRVAEAEPDPEVAARITGSWAWTARGPSSSSAGWAVR